MPNGSEEQAARDALVPPDGLQDGGRSAAGGVACAAQVAPTPPASAPLPRWVAAAPVLATAPSYPAWLNALIALGVLGGMLALFLVRRRRTARQAGSGPARDGTPGRL